MTVLVVTFPDPTTGALTIAADAGRLLAWQTPQLASVFAAGLAERGLEPAIVLPRSATQLADLLLGAGVDPDLAPARVELVEAQTVDAMDGARWSAELAGRVAEAVRSRAC